MRSQRKKEREQERERDLHTLSVSELLLAFVLARAHRFFLPFTVAAHSYLDFPIERTSLGSFAALRVFVFLRVCVCVYFFALLLTFIFTTSLQQLQLRFPTYIQTYMYMYNLFSTIYARLF